LRKKGRGNLGYETQQVREIGKARFYADPKQPGHGQTEKKRKKKEKKKILYFTRESVRLNRLWPAKVLKGRLAKSGVDPKRSRARHSFLLGGGCQGGTMEIRVRMLK